MTILSPLGAGQLSQWLEATQIQGNFSSSAKAFCVSTLQMLGLETTPEILDSRVPAWKACVTLGRSLSLSESHWKAEIISRIVGREK